MDFSGASIETEVDVLSLRKIIFIRLQLKMHNNKPLEDLHRTSSRYIIRRLPLFSVLGQGMSKVFFPTGFWIFQKATSSGLVGFLKADMGMMVTSPAKISAFLRNFFQHLHLDYTACN